ncbi:MAG: hypothetical protein JJE10_09170 [Thermoleophilia bacterium]|nr:hypothetical protein [Thermoleophilia bacterium]
MIHHYIDQALEERDLSEISRVGLDETSFKRGQSYVCAMEERESIKVLVKP